MISEFDYLQISAPTTAHHLAAPGSPAEHALISLLALNGLRVLEATGADTEHLGLERGHRTLVVTRKGGKVVTIPLAPRTAGRSTLAIGERTEGPLLVTADGRRLNRHGAAWIARRITRAQRGSPSTVSPHAMPQQSRGTIKAHLPAPRLSGAGNSFWLTPLLPPAMNIPLLSPPAMNIKIHGAAWLT
jgi:hypothetical protein